MTVAAAGTGGVVIFADAVAVFVTAGVAVSEPFCGVFGFTSFLARIALSFPSGCMRSSVKCESSA